MNTSAHFSGLSSLIQEELLKAKTSIQIAVAWFTDQSIYRVLLQKAQENVKVTVVLRCDAINFNGLDAKRIQWEELIGAGGQLHCSLDQPALHHKFCIIDEQRIVSGSYNWTYAARRNHENIIVCDVPEVVSDFAKSYSLLTGALRVMVKAPALIPESNGPKAEMLLEETAVDLAIRNQISDSTEAEEVYQQLVIEADEAYCVKKYPDAERLAKRAMELKPSRGEAYVVLGTVYWRQRQSEKCLALIQETESIIADATPLQRAQLFNLCGLALDNLAMDKKKSPTKEDKNRKLKQATQYFERSSIADPTSPIPYKNKFISFEDWRPTVAPLVATEGRRVATEEIKRYEDGGDGVRLLQAYLVQSSLAKEVDGRKHYAHKALATYNCLNPEERDLHDLDEIKQLLR